MSSNKQATRVLLTFIHAGGAAKTSSTRDIGYELTQRGKRVLLVDLDPQANLTEWLGVTDVEPGETIIAALQEYGPLPTPQQVHGLDLIPAHLDLTRTEMLLPALSNAEGRLREALAPVRESGEYDYILLDAPPSLGKLTANGANAADWVLVPLPASPKGLSALNGAREMLTEYTRANKTLRIATFLVTQGTATRISRDVAAAYQELLPGQTTGPITWRPAAYSRAIVEGAPVALVDADARAEVAAVVDQLLRTVGDV